MTLGLARCRSARYTLIAADVSTSRPETNYTAERMTIEVSEKRQADDDAVLPSGDFSRRTKNRERWWRFIRRCGKICMSCMRGRVRRPSQPVIHAYLNPLVKWIWLGGAIVVMGTFLALLPNRQAAMVLRAVTQPAALPIAAGVMPQIAPASSHHDGSD